MIFSQQYLQNYNNKEEVKELFNCIGLVEGFLFNKEVELLYLLAKSCKGNGVIVEIGSWQGKSAICLGKGSKQGAKSKIYSIDPHTNSKGEDSGNFKILESNIQKANLQDIVSFIIDKAENAVVDFNESIELLFIDGFHQYQSVKLDYELWVPKVIDGGIVIFHDTTDWEGPKKLVKEIAFKANDLKIVEIIDSSTVTQKVNKVSFSDRLKGIALIIKKDLKCFLNKTPIRK